MGCHIPFTIRHMMLNGRTMFPTLALSLIWVWHIASAEMVFNPDVRQDTIDETICVKGYTKSIRPSALYTNGVKEILLLDGGIDTAKSDEYQLDHLISLGLGGHPRARGNLALQRLDGDEGAKRKDRLEVKLQCLVCSRQVSLSTAQDAIYLDWIAAYHYYAKVKCDRSH